MKLLYITRKVDEQDFLAGFNITWIKAFAHKFSSVTIICLEKGLFTPPDNVKVFSMGKERRIPRWRILANLIRLCIEHIPSHDAVFVHMIPLYGCVAGPIARFFRKPIIQWYTHKQVSLLLHCSAFFARRILTASRESCNLKTHKKLVAGHGIDTSQFKLLNLDRQPFSLLYPARISPIKRIETAIYAVKNLCSHYPDIHLFSAGITPENSDSSYFKMLKRHTDELKISEKITFLGPVQNPDMPELYNENSIVLNFCPAGGMDKAVLEGMLCGCIPVVFNKTFRKVFGKYASLLLCEEETPECAAKKIQAVLNLSDEKQNEIRNYLSERTRMYYSLEHLVYRIHSLFSQM